MGYRHTKGEILAGALAVAFENGLSRLTFGRVAKHLGISDRVVVYYFPSMDDLVSEVLISIGVQLQGTLEPVFNAPVVDHLELVRAAWPVVANDQADSVFALFFEANGLAAAGRAPYSAVVPQLVEAWITWAAEFFRGTAKERRTEAETAIALLDGLILLRQLAGSDSASRAAKRMGVT
jgi:AcrR family transcriptional regulator